MIEIEIVRRCIRQNIDSGQFPVVLYNGDDLKRVFEDDTWISRCNSVAGGDIALTTVLLDKMLQWRLINKIQDKIARVKLSDCEKLIKKYGKDKNGRALLTFNMSEIEKYSQRSDTFIGDSIMRWFEELDRGGHDKFSIVLFHGVNKNMEKLPKLLLLIQDIAAGYTGFLETIYIFEDVLSHDCRKQITMLSEYNAQITMLPQYNAQIKYVNIENVSNVLKFNLALYLGSKVESHQDEIKNGNPTNKSVMENASKEQKNKEDVEETKTKEASDAVQSIEENKNGDKLLRETLKRLLSLQKELNSIINDIATKL